MTVLQMAPAVGSGVGEADTVDRRLVVMGAAWQYTVSYTQPAVELG